MQTRISNTRRARGGTAPPAPARFQCGGSGGGGRADCVFNVFWSGGGRKAAGDGIALPSHPWLCRNALRTVATARAINDRALRAGCRALMGRRRGRGARASRVGAPVGRRRAPPSGARGLSGDRSPRQRPRRERGLRSRQGRAAPIGARGQSAPGAASKRRPDTVSAGARAPRTRAPRAPRARRPRRRGPRRHAGRARVRRAGCAGCSRRPRAHRVRGARASGRASVQVHFTAKLGGQRRHRARPVGPAVRMAARRRVRMRRASRKRAGLGFRV